MKIILHNSISEYKRMKGSSKNYICKNVIAKAYVPADTY